MRGRVILSLCDHTGNWSQPYADAGYEVVRVDLKPTPAAWVRCECCENFWCRIHGKHAHDCSCPAIEESEASPYDETPGQDVRLLLYPGRVHGLLAAPPCTVFANSGAWVKRTPAEMIEGLSIVDACLRLVAVCQPQWWALENPVGKLRRYLGPPTMTFNPCDFGDAYQKRTLLWGRFTPPVPDSMLTTARSVEPVRVCSQGSWVQTLGGKSERTKELRSATPMGFARAFFEANP